MPETFLVRSERFVENDLTSIPDAFPAAVMDGTWGVQANAGVAVFGVIVREEHPPEDPGVVDAGEIVRECRTIFQSLECRLRIRVIVRLTG